MKRRIKLRNPNRDRTPKKAQAEEVEEELSPEDRARQAAKDAVQEFEQLKAAYYEEEELFRENFPEAQAALDDLNKQKDSIVEQINVAKGLVKRAGISIGDFKFSQPMSRPGFDGKKLVEELCKLPPQDAGVMLKKLYDRGVITEMKTDKEVSNLVYSSDDQVADAVGEAWDEGGKKLSSRCEVPKF